MHMYTKAGIRAVDAVSHSNAGCDRVKIEAVHPNGDGWGVKTDLFSVVLESYFSRLPSSLVPRVVHMYGLQLPGTIPSTLSRLFVRSTLTIAHFSILQPSVSKLCMVLVIARVRVDPMAWSTYTVSPTLPQK